MNNTTSNVEEANVRHFCDGDCGGNWNLLPIDDSTGMLFLCPYCGSRDYYSIANFDEEIATAQADIERGNYITWDEIKGI